MITANGQPMYFKFWIIFHKSENFIIIIIIIYYIIIIIIIRERPAIQSTIYELEDGKLVFLFYKRNIEKEACDDCLDCEITRLQPYDENPLILFKSLVFF